MQHRHEWITTKAALYKKAGLSYHNSCGAAFRPLCRWVRHLRRPAGVAPPAGCRIFVFRDDYSRKFLITQEGEETVEKEASPLFRERLHERQSSISCEKVGLPFVRGVISDVHAAGNDGLNFIPAAAAAGTPCRRAFSTSRSPPAEPAGISYF